MKGFVEPGGRDLHACLEDDALIGRTSNLYE